MALPFLSHKTVCRNLHQPKIRSHDRVFTAVHQLHRGKLDSQHSLPPNTSAEAHLCNQLEQTMKLRAGIIAWSMRSTPLHVWHVVGHKEGSLVSLKFRLVSERKFNRMQRSTSREVQRRLSELWEAFNQKEKSVRQLLKRCDNVNRPVMHWTELNWTELNWT